MEGRFRKAEFAREGGVQNQLLVHVIEACAAAFQWGNTSPIISHHLPSSPIISHHLPSSPIISHHLPFTPRTRHWKCVKVSTIHSKVLEETKKSLNICPAAFQWYRVVGHKHELPKLPEETVRNLHRGLSFETATDVGSEMVVSTHGFEAFHFHTAQASWNLRSTQETTTDWKRSIKP